MIFGIGIDIVAIARVSSIYLKYQDKFADKILHPNELPVYKQARNKIHFLAKRFAAKEAFAKALGTGISGFRFTDIEIKNNTRGKPELILHAKCRQLIEDKKIKQSHLSISDEREYAIAFVILEV